MLFTRFPGWAVSGLILLGGGACFLAWWVSFKFRNATGLSNLQFAVGSEVGTPVDVEKIKAGELVLCGNALFNFRTGELFTKRWLQDFGDTAPPIVKILPAEKLVICGNRGFAQAFGFDGKAKREISLGGKPIGAAAYSFTDSRVAFVHEGNLWSGHVDWIESTINNAKRLTDVGFFRDTFRGDWFWHGDTLWVSVLGKPHRVDLVSGSVTQDAANAGQISRGISPDGQMSAVAFGHGNFVVVNLADGEARQFPIRGKFREFLWLDEHRLAYGSNQNEISMLDASTGKIAAYPSPAAVLKLTAASPEGESLMIGTSKGPMIFSTKSGTFVPVDLPMEDGVWLDETSMLCTNRSTDSSLRGIWRVNANGSKERVTNQPADSIQAASGARPMIAIAHGALWISGGNLWRYDLKSRAVNQLTQNQNLSPNLQILP